jgi:glycosyltransferase involved in cell wall biosynthesis
VTGPSCIAVIPCLNESRTIGGIVQGVRKFLPHVVVIDDGSTDDTARVALAAGAEVRGHRTPQGKGAALSTGFAFARERGFAWALSLDGDGQHAPEDVPVFLGAREADAADLIVGNRMPSAQGMPWVRRQVNRWMSRRLSRLAGRDLPDTQCGFRLMNLEAWARLSLHTRNFEVESEILLAFVRAGYRVAFVPIRVIYKSEQSKIHPVRDTIRWFRWWGMAKRR